LYGLIAPPGQTAYAASKFAVRGFSMSLRHELQGTGVGVTVVHPGGVATSIGRNARVAKDISPEEMARRLRIMEALMTMPPPTAAGIIVRGVERRKGRIIVGRDAKIASFVERLFPVSYWKLIGRRRRQ
jgi:short-subunit dehydrogenase